MITHLPTIQEHETLRISISSGMMGVPSLEEFTIDKDECSLQIPSSYCRPEYISKPFGGYNLDTVHAYQNIASLLVDVQKFEQALEVSREVVEILARLFGPSHLAIATTHHKMGEICELMGNPSQALEYYQEALRIREKLLGRKDANAVATQKKVSHLKFQMMASTPTVDSFPQ